MAAAPPRNRLALYVALNLAFPLVLAMGYALGAPQSPRILYLVLLFALCSSYVIDFDGLNGRFALLGLFLNMYWIYFGLQDLTDLYNGVSRQNATGIITTTELVILVGGVILVAAYRLAAGLGVRTEQVERSMDWSIRSVLLVGLTLWIVGICATYYWYFFVVTDKTIEGTKGIGKLGQYLATGLVLAEMLQPLGTLLLAYAWRKTRSAPLLGLVIVMILVQILFGFVIDIKGMAISGLSLVIVTIVFTDGRIPKLWVASAVIFIYVAFPVFQAYRAVVSGNVARTEVLSNLGATIEKVLAAKDRVNSGRERAQTFFERLSLKASVQMIVDGTANGIPFQNGYTLTPILSAFLPRIFWTDKPDIPTGRIVNKVFHVTEQEETYISPSHLGDLYWNFGWAGVIVGMTIIGGLTGIVARYNMASCPTVTRLLLTIITIELVIHGFEGALAGYVVWLRSIAAVGLMHLMFAKVPVVGRSREGESPRAGESPELSGPLRPFPNLLT